MQRRDWAGTAVITALITLAALLHSHILAASLLGAVAFLGCVVVIADVFGSRIGSAFSVLAKKSPVSVRVERRRRTPAVQLPPGQRGLLDFRRDGERARDAATEILQRMGEEMDKYTKAVSRHTRRMEKANKGGPTVEHVYKLTEAYAKDIDSYAVRTERLEALFRVERVRMVENFHAWIAGQSPGTDISGMLDELRETGQITAGARGSVEGFRQAVVDLRQQNVSQPVNRATDRLIAAVSNQIENLLAIETFCLNPTGPLP